MLSCWICGDEKLPQFIHPVDRCCRDRVACERRLRLLLQKDLRRHDRRRARQLPAAYTASAVPVDQQLELV